MENNSTTGVAMIPNKNNNDIKSLSFAEKKRYFRKKWKSQNINTFNNSAVLFGIKNFPRTGTPSEKITVLAWFEAFTMEYKSLKTRKETLAKLTPADRSILGKCFDIEPKKRNESLEIFVERAAKQLRSNRRHRHPPPPSKKNEEKETWKSSDALRLFLVQNGAAPDSVMASSHGRIRFKGTSGQQQEQQITRGYCTSKRPGDTCHKYREVKIGETTTVQVHQVVFMAFYNKPFPTRNTVNAKGQRLVICHDDTVPLDADGKYRNWPIDLRLCTQSENITESNHEKRRRRNNQ